MKPTPSSRDEASRFLRDTAHLGVDAQRRVLDTMTRLNRYRRDREALELARAAVPKSDAVDRMPRRDKT